MTKPPLYKIVEVGEHWQDGDLICGVLNGSSIMLNSKAFIGNPELERNLYVSIVLREVKDAQASFNVPSTRKIEI